MKTQFFKLITRSIEPRARSRKKTKARCTYRIHARVNDEVKAHERDGREKPIVARAHAQIVAR